MNHIVTDSASTSSLFILTHVVEPTTQHTHTATVLHGPGGDGERPHVRAFPTPKLPKGNSLAERQTDGDGCFLHPLNDRAQRSSDLPPWFKAIFLIGIYARQSLCKYPGSSSP